MASLRKKKTLKLDCFLQPTFELQGI